MSQYDVVNPEPGWQQQIGDSMSPDYGFGITLPPAPAAQRAVGGPPYRRRLDNTLHIFELSWVNRSPACVEKLKGFYRIAEDGFVTVIDWDDNQRNYVGTFSGPMRVTRTGYGMQSVLNLRFEEIPGAPMLVYPNNWDDAAWHYALRDDGTQQVAVQGVWNQTQRQAGITTRMSLDNAGTNAGDWAQYEYLGYGFQLYLMQGPAQGQADVYLDGTLLQTVDCYSPAAVAQPGMVLQKTNVSPDFHRVMVVTKNAKNAAASAPAIGWWALRAMR